MLFSTFDFLLFFMFVFLVQIVLPYRPRNIWLLGASWFFYGCWDWRFLRLLIAFTVFDHGCSRRSALQVVRVAPVAVGDRVLHKGLFKKAVIADKLALMVDGGCAWSDPTGIRLCLTLTRLWSRIRTK